MMHKIQIGCVSDTRKRSADLKNKIIKKFDFIDLDAEEKRVDLIIVCGGDGTLLHTIHRYMHLNIPFYGINTGNIGFIMNPYKEAIFEQRDLLKKLTPITIYPLAMEAVDKDNNKFSAIAINEVSVLRSSHQTAQLKVKIDSSTEISKLVCDGILLSTPAGSTAYNLSVGGPIVPLNANILSLMPISPFRPRRWKGALLHQESTLEITVISSKNRPVSVYADFQEFKNICSFTAKIAHSSPIKIFFNEETSFEHRVLKEQFLT